MSPVQVAAAYGQSDALKLLLDRSAPVDLRDASGTTPLMAAANTGQHECVNILLEHGASIYLADWGNRTPWHHAVYSGQGVCAKTLIRAGFDPRVTDERGMTGAQWLEFVVAQGYPNVNASLQRELLAVATLVAKHRQTAEQAAACSAPELNGKSGVIAALSDGVAGRYQVQLEVQSRMVVVKAENLVLADKLDPYHLSRWDKTKLLKTHFESCFSFHEKMKSRGLVIGMNGPCTDDPVRPPPPV